MANPGIQFLPTGNQDQLAQIAAIQRSQQLAQQLLDNGQEQAPNAMAGNVVYRHSPLEQLIRGISTGVGSYENNKANKMAAELQGQQFSSLLNSANGGQSGGGNGVGGLSGQDLAQARIAQMIGGDPAEKAYFDRTAPTNEQKNAAASGQANPVALAGALQAAQEGQKIGNYTIGGVANVPATGATALGLGNQMAQAIPGVAPQTDPGMLGGPTAPPPGPVNSSPLAPPPGQGSMNVNPMAPNNPGMTLPPNAGMNGQSALPPPSAPPTPPGTLPTVNGAMPQPNAPSVNPAYSAAVAPSQPAPVAGNAIAPPAIGDDPRYTASVAAQGSGQKTLADANATNTGEDLKTLKIMLSNAPVLKGRLATIRNNIDDASYGYGVNNDGDGKAQEFANQFLPKKASANAMLEQASSQSVLPELGPQLQQAGVKGNKFLETIANNAVGLNMAAPPTAKHQVVDGLQNAYINNLKAVAGRVRAAGQPAPADSDIDNMFVQSSMQNPVAAELARRGLK